MVLILTLVSEFSVAAKLGCVQNLRGQGDRSMIVLPPPLLHSSNLSFHHPGILFYLHSTIQIESNFAWIKDQEWLMPLLHSSSRLPAPLSAPVCPSEPEKQIAEEEVTARRPCIINIQSVVPFWIICICLPHSSCSMKWHELSLVSGLAGADWHLFIMTLD